MPTLLQTAIADSGMGEVEFDEEGREAIARLERADLARIDQAILSALDRTWKKAGFVAAGVMISAPDAYEEIPEMFYVLRIGALARASRIEVKGDLSDLKTSQIRLAAAHGDD